ncbi:MAG: hypothetical protein KDK26_15680 [Roseivivax sp.]|nr:hypothetical protein [Roseivivax sp.]
MGYEQMLGVVLWSDPRDGTAIIWCEDHGELALYPGVETRKISGAALAAGDLIQFEVSHLGKVRFARNPRHLGSGRFPSIAAALTEAAGEIPQVRRQARRREFEIA